MAPGVAAHVSRTVGPYTILVVLVEEPIFQDNHAGFEFWVRKEGVAIAGLERTIRAQASGHGQRIDLVVSPLDEHGYYVVDHTASGVAFDPRGGGAWTLTLTGSIERTAFRTSFPVTFPGYPRVAVASPPGVDAAGSGGETSLAGQPLWFVPAVIAAGVICALAALAITRRRRPRKPEAS